MSAISIEASSIAWTSERFGFVIPVTLRMNCFAAASISSRVAGGSSPRSSVMFRHMPSS